MTTAMASSGTNQNFGRILRIGTITTVGAMVINALLFTFGNLPTEFVPFGAVIGMTFMGGFTATLGNAILTRFLSQKTANRVMLGGIVLVLLGFTYNPFTIPNVSITTIVSLQIMHAVAALPALNLTR